MKFILTKELGRLSKWLRILGFDAAYFKQGNASSLIIEALRDGRIIITRNQRLPKSGGIQIVLIRQENLKGQLQELLNTLKISLERQAMFSRCIICNVELKDIDKKEVKLRVPAYVFETQEHFVICPKCNRIYWPGTHWGNVEKALERIGKNGIHS
ncbi:MAG: Mut7-C RNAse domain-containing protein [Candidatus Omnitrophica bacterium]|nr:Mut7-C RNAse domain-containing protein [Candidatus Omnitrophota bacterium]MDD5237838.1 Mut7-C RNAse domain-containing protein [Candidatus Omnitrophota bacterium]